MSFRDGNLFSYFFHGFWEKIIKLLTYYFTLCRNVVYIGFVIYFLCDNVYVYKIIT